MFVPMPRPFLRKLTRERAAAVFLKTRTYTHVGLASLPFKRTDRSLHRLPLADTATVAQKGPVGAGQVDNEQLYYGPF